LGPKGKDIQTFDKQAALVAKGGIETASAQTHSLEQLGQRGGLITFLPKKHNGLLDGPVPVKFNWSRHGMVMDLTFQKDQEGRDRGSKNHGWD
jgi:hypothetical protein